jgi:hypothetical protein
MGNKEARAAVGFRVHSGWAALVAVSGPLAAPVVVDRRRIDLAEPSVPGSAQPFHAAEGRRPAQAEEIIKRCTVGARRLARTGLRATLDDLRSKGHPGAACGLLLASGRPLPDLPAILASHALIHTADGELYRDALTDAAGHCGLALLRIKERELLARGARVLKVREDALLPRLSEMGRPLGPPWRQDEKLAALVAWLALAECRVK